MELAGTVALESDSQQGMTRHEIELSAGTIEYEDSGGEGPVIVLLHGLLMDASLWDGVTSDLSADYRCVAPTLPLGAHRYPMSADADLSLRSIARLVAEFLDRLALRDVTLVGNDTGGALAQLLICDEAVGMDRVVLVSCDAFDNYPPGLTGRVLVPTGKLSPAVFGLFMQQMRLRPLRRLPIAFGWLTKHGDAATARWLKPILQQPEIRRDTVHVLRTISAEPDLMLKAAERLPGFDRPALVVWAKEDRVMPPEHGRRLAGLLPQGRLVEEQTATPSSPKTSPSGSLRSSGSSCASRGYPRTHQSELRDRASHVPERRTGTRPVRHAQLLLAVASLFGAAVKAVIIHATGGADVLRLEEVERPEPGEDEVLIRVQAAAVNPVDWKYRCGLVPRELPAVLGEDVSGAVAISRADGFAPGNRVFGVTTSGGYGEYATASATAIAIKPDALSHEQAAALPVSGLTAWQALFDRGRLEFGQRVLIAGAAGGVGHLAVQFAKHAGAHVIGTGSARNRDFVLSLGAGEFIDYTHGDVADAVSGVDLALDTVGGSTASSLLPTLREGGTLVTIAYPPEKPPQDCRCWVKPLIMRPSAEQLARIANLVASGVVRVEIAELELPDVRRAHAVSESGHARGKIVLTVRSSRAAGAVPPNVSGSS